MPSFFAAASFLLPLVFYLADPAALPALALAAPLSCLFLHSWIGALSTPCLTSVVLANRPPNTGDPPTAPSRARAAPASPSAPAVQAAYTYPTYLGKRFIRFNRAHTNLTICCSLR
ncbi:MAG: hypothetical protein ACE5I5_07325 [Candidatus Heimdallarchaeota archaeon]